MRDKRLLGLAGVRRVPAIHERRGSDSTFEFWKDADAVKGMYDRDMKEYGIRFNQPVTVKLLDNPYPTWGGGDTKKLATTLKKGDTFTFKVNKDYSIDIIKPFKDRWSAGWYSIALQLGRNGIISKVNELVEAGDGGPSPAEIKKHLNTAASNMEFAKEVMKADPELGKQMYDHAKNLWDAMQNLKKSRRRGAV